MCNRSKPRGGRGVTDGHLPVTSNLLPVTGYQWRVPCPSLVGLLSLSLVSNSVVVSGFYPENSLYWYYVINKVPFSVKKKNVAKPPYAIPADRDKLGSTRRPHVGRSINRRRAYVCPLQSQQDKRSDTLSPNLRNHRDNLGALWLWNIFFNYYGLHRILSSWMYSEPYRH
jgi:hypothetical protein